MFAIDDELKREVIRELNAKHTESLIDPEKCKAFYEELEKKLTKLRSDVDPSNKECFIGQLVYDCETYNNNVKQVKQETNHLVEEITKDLTKVEEIREQIQPRITKLNTLQCTVQYMKVVQRIEFLNDELEREMSGKNDIERTTTIFANLCEISRNLTDSPANNLRNYLKESLHYWHNILKTKLAKDMEDVLKAIKWPFVSANFNLVTPLAGNIQKLQVLTEYLLQIEIPSESSTPNVTSAILSDFPQLSLPIHFLIQPLRKRFLYHFYGTRQTNRPDKPEWYFTQILTWIRDHQEFVAKYIQPIVNKLALHHIDAKLEFIRGLVQMAVEKLHADLPQLQYDDYNFSHTVDEALGFDKELRDTYNYPPIQPGVIGILTQASIFVKWLGMEKKFATEKMDMILSPSSVDAFEPLTQDVEDLKITTCGDAFITLLQTITERYEALPQPGHRLQFLDLQLDLLDDFRVRLLQLVNAEDCNNVVESSIPMIANTIYYIENVLVDWGAMLHFLNLYYYRNKGMNLDSPSAGQMGDLDDSSIIDIEGDNVFSEILSLYRHMRRDLLLTLSESVVMEVKVRSKNYRRERWSHMSTSKDFRSISLTPSACPMFDVIAKRLHQLEKHLQTNLFTNVWRSIAQQIDTHLFEDLIMDNRFNEGGALQFKFDIIRNLLPLFSQFSEKPNNYFVQVVEACNLFNITKGTALLLRDTLIALEGATGVEDTRGIALRDVGVTNFSPKMAINILNQRTDITVNRVVFD